MEVAADQVDLLERLRPAAHQRRALDGVLDLSVLDPERLAGGKHELATGDVDLPTTEVGGIQTTLDAGHDLARVLVASQHVGVGHARHRDVRIALATTIAGRLDFHQTRVQCVLHVALQDTVFDQNVALGWISFVIDVQAAAPTRQSPIIEHRHATGRHTLSQPPAERAGSLAVEIPFQTVTDRFMQQHARPAWSQNHRHFAGRSGSGLQIRHGGVNGFIHVPAQQHIVDLIQAETPATPG